MMSPKDTSLEEEEGADVGRSKRDRVGREGGVESCCRDLNCSGVYGTHEGEGVGRGKRDGKMAYNPHDSRRKDELITGC